MSVAVAGNGSGIAVKARLGERGCSVFDLTLKTKKRNRVNGEREWTATC
jgi:hypothetical protein